MLASIYQMTCILIHILANGEVGTPLNRFKPSSKLFLRTVPRRPVLPLWIIYVILSCFVMLSCTFNC